MSRARQVRGGVFNRTEALAGEHCQQSRSLRKISARSLHRGRPWNWNEVDP
jgi:hypothetical protein